MRQQNEADNHPPHHVSHHDLKKSKIGIVGQPGNADDGERTGFRRHDRKRNRPPRNISPCKKIVAKRPLFFAEAQAE